jgi:hypothetical protein
MVFPADWVALLCDHGVTNVVFSFCRRCDECRGFDCWMILTISSPSHLPIFFCGFGLVYDVLGGYSVEA